MNKHFFKLIFVFILLPVIPIPNMAETIGPQTPEATLDQTVFKARGANETLLNISKPGRYSIQVKSEQGTELIIVDRMAGPYESAGTAGNKDGRLDLLLDIGTYKIRLYSHTNGSGQAVLKVFPFEYVNPVTRVESLPYLPHLELVRGSLEDLQQQAFWIQIKERQVLRLEMLGRSLKDARLWKDGSWLEDVNPTITTFEPVPGQPMTHAEFHHDLNPGLYLLTCYGGPALQWTKETGQYPFYLRMGIPELGKNGQRLLEISPFGRDTFLISGETNFFQLVREQKKPAQLTTSAWGETKGRYSSYWRSASINKKSRDPWCFIKGSASSRGQWVTITAPPGDILELDYFVQQYYHTLEEGERSYWISSIHSAEGRDAIDITALLTYPTMNTPVKAEVVTISPKEAMIRKVNLLGTLTVYLFIEEEGTYVIDENPDAGAKGSYQLKPFMITLPEGYQPPPFQDAGTDFELVSGYYVLTIQPKAKGILHFALHKKANWLSRTVKSVFSSTPSALKKEPQQAAQSLLWPEVKLQNISPYHQVYTLWLNQRADVESGIIVRALPLNLEEPLPITLNPGQSVVMKVRHDRKMKLMVIGGQYRVKVDDVPWDGTSPLAAGFHHLELENKDSKTRLFNVITGIMEPYIPPPPPVIKKIEDIFPIMTVKKPLFKDFDYNERKQFLLQVKTPALYRLETTGRMATSITVRSRVTTSLFNASQNGIGRNALVQQYFKPGDYLVNVQAMGQSKGRAGIFLKRTELENITGLSDGTIKRCSVLPDAAVRYQVDIKELGYYYLGTYSLGKPLTHRLEDVDGWPLMTPDRQGAIERYYKKGTYFYYSLPQPVESRRVTFLRRIPEKREISGKGPHQLELNKSLENIWMEDEQRSPDIYKTEITAPIQAALTVPGNMEAKIFGEDGKEFGTTSKGEWSGRLPAGNYDLKIISIEKNNRLPYTILLATRDLIPGLTQPVRNLPAQMDVSLDRDSLVDITSFGDVDVKAALWDSDGKISIAAADDMPHDWNFRISRSLKAGQYRLNISAADSGSGAVDIWMQTRKELALERQAIPFVIKKTISTEVLKIPFSTDNSENLLHIKVKSREPLKLALMRDDRLLAEGMDQLYIPLPGLRQYTLLAWAEEGASGETQIDAAAVKLREVRVTEHQQTIPSSIATAVQLRNETDLSFYLKSQSGKKDTFYYSPLLERPCLLVTEAVEGTSNDCGWLVGSGTPVRLETIEVKSGRSTDVVLNDIPLTFKINQQQPAPLLLEVKSVNALMGSAVFPIEHQPDNIFVRSGMLAAPSRTLVGIPGSGQYRVHTWLTTPTPPVTSEKNRFDTGERTRFTLTAYPKQKEVDFRSTTAIEAEVEAEHSVWLRIKEEPQLLEMTLAHGLAAFSWYQGRAVAIVAAMDKNTQKKMTVQGEILYVVNTGEHPARFRAEKRGAPPTELTTLDPTQGFEKILSTAGTLQFYFSEIPEGKKLFVAGTQVNSQLWGKDGKIYRGIALKQSRNVDMEFYETNGGFLEIRHGPGLVKIWLASTADNGQSFIGNRDTAEKALFKDGMGPLTPHLQEWEFFMESAGYISVETLVPTAMALVSDHEVLYISAEAFHTGHQLNHYLPSGTYRLLTRPLPGAGSGTLTLKTITPTLLEEEKESAVQLIRPGEIQVFRFHVQEQGDVGVGLRTENDSLEAQLFDEKSHLVATGPLVVKKLPPGTYLLVVKTRDVPVQYRPLILGTKGSREGVPEDVIQKYKKEANQ
jgi:hypothetical protein